VAKPEKSVDLLIRVQYIEVNKIFQERFGRLLFTLAFKEADISKNKGL